MFSNRDAKHLVCLDNIKLKTIVYEEKFNLYRPRQDSIFRR